MKYRPPSSCNSHTHASHAHTHMHHTHTHHTHTHTHKHTCTHKHTHSHTLHTHSHTLHTHTGWIRWSRFQDSPAMWLPACELEIRPVCPGRNTAHPPTQQQLYCLATLPAHRTHRNAPSELYVLVLGPFVGSYEQPGNVTSPHPASFPGLLQDPTIGLGMRPVHTQPHSQAFYRILQLAWGRGQSTPTLILSGLVKSTSEQNSGYGSLGTITFQEGGNPCVVRLYSQTLSQLKLEWILGTSKGTWWCHRYPSTAIAMTSSCPLGAGLSGEGVQVEFN